MSHKKLKQTWYNLNNRQYQYKKSTITLDDVLQLGKEIAYQLTCSIPRFDLLLEHPFYNVAVLSYLLDLENQPLCSSLGNTASV
jgi:hypothetical protein